MGVHREHNAADAYPRWKAAVAAADWSIVIFTPYFDALIDQLIRKAPSAVTIITDLSPQSGAQDYLGQLRAIKKLLYDGIEVRHLARLHAKVLWVDDGTVVYGSQNFTRYGRKSKEASTSPVADLTGTPFTDTLAEWLNESEPVDAEFIELLLADTAASAKKLAAAGKELRSAYEQTLAIRENKLQRRKEVAARAARAQLDAEQFANITRSIRQPQGTAHLRKTYKYDSSYIPYASMDSKNTEDLTTWMAIDDDGTRRSIKLHRAKMYPVLFPETGQMAFLRVMKTCITYVRFAVGPMGHSTLRTEGGKQFTAAFTLRFPNIKESGSNLRLTFKVEQYGIPLSPIQVSVHFTARDLVIDGIETIPPTNPPSADRWEEGRKSRTEREAAIAALFDLPAKRRGFFRQHLSGFTYKSLGIDDKNVNDLFTQDHYELGMIEYAGVPVLLARHEALGVF